VRKGVLPEKEAEEISAEAAKEPVNTSAGSPGSPRHCFAGESDHEVLV
jgi:hypothetical protein